MPIFILHTIKGCPFRSLKVRAGARLVFALSLIFFLVGCLKPSVSSLTSKPEPTPTLSKSESTPTLMSSCKNMEKNMCLVSGSKEGDIDKVRDALDKGATVDFNYDNSVDSFSNIFRTSLMWASELGHLEIVKVLIAAGANVNYQHPLGDTVLLRAIKTSHLEIVKVLIAAGANVNIKDGMGNTVLMRARREGHLEIVKVLIAAGATE